MNAIPLSLYVHFPWCVKKCPYCDFNSHAIDGNLPEESYIDALLKDLQIECQLEPRRNLHSIFLGGGTPSLFSGPGIRRLLARIDEVFNIQQSEITLEANPGTFDQSNFEAYYQAGVNRISLGAQSFEQRQLQQLGRIHQASDVEKTFQGARAAGFSRINIDLMFGLPDQSIEAAMTDLEQAITLKPEHISWYQLTIEPNTVFHRFPPTTPDEDTLGEMTEQGHALLKKAGYDQYEISAFAQTGEEAQHNLNYWQFGDYIGIGAGAHGKLTGPDQIVRTNKTRVPADYLDDAKRIEKVVAAEELTLEFLLNALRLTNGFELSLFEQTTRLPISELDDFVAQATEQGFIQMQGAWLRPTEKGRGFLNDMLLLI